MSDGTGSDTYSYDELSRMVSETQTISGLSGGLTIGYQYALSGQLKKITDPSSAEIDYAFDRTGRLTGVTGSGTLYSSVSTYASNISYRGWGAVKSMDYGDSTTETLEYNNRLQPTSYSVTGVKVYGSSTSVAEGGDYTYYNDGLLKFASDDRTDNSTWHGLHDRAYKFDHVGRLKEAYAALRAQDYQNGTSHSSYGDPILHNFTFDAFGNTVSREGLYWSQFDDGDDTYNSQNRNTSWSYDADGRITSTNDPAPDSDPWSPLALGYDAAGKQSASTQTTSWEQPDLLGGYTLRTTVYDRDSSYDGNGVLIKLAENSQVNSETPTTSASYYLRSSVTGNVIREYDYSGAMVKSNVFIGNQMIAQQSVSTGNTQMLWQHKNPVTGDSVSTDSTGHSMAVTRMDPTGVGIGDSDPFSTPQAGFGEVAGQDTSQPLMGSMVAGFFPTGGSAGCTVDGMLTGCALVNTILGAGAGTQCPENDCGPRALFITNSEGETRGVLLTPFMSFANGVSGNFFPTILGLGTPEEQADQYELALNLAARGITPAQVGGYVSEASSFTGGIEAGDNQCDLMAQKLQGIVDQTIKDLGGVQNLTDHAKLDSFVDSIDQTFTPFFLGVPGLTADKLTLANTSGGVPGPPRPFSGENGFKGTYQDTYDPGQDQTHHFAAYFSAGIHGMDLLATGHKWLTDTFNFGDRHLGDAAFELGASLNSRQVVAGTHVDRNNPRFPITETTYKAEAVDVRLRRILGIADAVRTSICN